MGEAKRRGSREERALAAIAANETLQKQLEEQELERRRLHRERMANAPLPEPDRGVRTSSLHGNRRLRGNANLMVAVAALAMSRGNTP